MWDELKTTDEFDAGVLRIDWLRRTWQVEGVGGHGNDVMMPNEVLATLREIPQPETEVFALVAWKENADGRQQVCFYDLATFEGEVFGPLESRAAPS